MDPGPQLCHPRMSGILMEGATGDPDLAGRRLSERGRPRASSPCPPQLGSLLGAPPGCRAELGWDWLGAAPPGAWALVPAPGEEL